MFFKQVSAFGYVYNIMVWNYYKELTSSMFAFIIFSILKPYFIF